jgi:hypothetical protein
MELPRYERVGQASHWLYARAALGMSDVGVRERNDLAENMSLAMRRWTTE